MAAPLDSAPPVIEQLVAVPVVGRIPLVIVLWPAPLVGNAPLATGEVSRTVAPVSPGTGAPATVTVTVEVAGNEVCATADGESRQNSSTNSRFTADIL
jgi:hypothetical protein